MEATMIELTEQQRQAAVSRPEEPPRLVDPLTRETYVLLRADVYERLRAVVEEEYDPREAYLFVDRVMAADDVNDPTLESYQS
jgi:hypothetical protein